MKHFLRKALAVMAIVSMGGVTTTSAQETTTVYERGTTTAWSETDISSSEWSTANDDKGTLTIDQTNGLTYTIVSDYDKSSNPKGGIKTSGSASKSITVTPNSFLTIHAVWNNGNSTGRNGNYNYFSIGDLVIKSYGQDQKGGIQIGNDDEVAIMNTDATKKADNRGGTWTIDLTIDLAKGEITYNITSSGKGSAKGTLNHSNGSYNNLSVGFHRAGSTLYNVNNYLSSISISEEKQTVTTAEYTVNITDGTNTLKTDSRTGVVGDDITISASDKTSFFNDDKSVKYIYVNDDSEGKTIAADGSTVINVTYRKAQKYNYTITSSYNGETLDFSTKGSVWEDENEVTVQYPRFQAYNSNELVEKKPNGNDLTQNFTIDKDNYIGNLEYSVTDVKDLYLLKEAEDIDGASNSNTNATTFTSRVSNGKIYYAANGTLVNLPAGKYKFTLGVIGTRYDNKVAVPINYTVSAGDNQIISGSCSGNTLTLLSSKEFTLTDATDITFTCDNPASSRGIDLFYVEKIEETSATITIPSSGYATYVGTSNLDFTNSDVTAYALKYDADNNKVTYTKIESAVPAGTAILVNGTAGDHIVNVAAEAKAIDTDLQGSATEAKTTDGTQYILVNDAANGLGWYKAKANGSIAAGKGYLVITSLKAKMFYSIDNSTVTGIEAIENAQKTNVNSDIIYNLAGQRVGKNYKGVVIVNGKKVIR